MLHQHPLRNGTGELIEMEMVKAALPFRKRRLVVEALVPIARHLHRVRIFPWRWISESDLFITSGVDIFSPC
jgi:hypothetical protein